MQKPHVSLLLSACSTLLFVDCYEDDGDESAR